MDHSVTTNDFIRDGYCEIPKLLTREETGRLLQRIRATRPFDSSLFLSKEEWNAGTKSHARTTPGPGYNLTEKLGSSLDCVTRESRLNETLSELLGRNYTWFSKKVVCRIPYTTLPAWLQEKLAERPGNTLNAFVKEPYRDIVYFLDNMLHQDNLEWARLPAERKEHRLVTLHVDLWDGAEPVSPPIVYLPKSHRFGATPYPAEVYCEAGKSLWEYHPSPHAKIPMPWKSLPSGMGDASLWHSCLVHGAWRIRKESAPHMMLICKAMPAREVPCLLDTINQDIDGPIYLETDYSGPARLNKDGFWDFPDNAFFELGKQWA